MNEAALHSRAGGPAGGPSGPKKGFCFRFRTPDGSSRVFVNVCGHADVGLPVGASGAAVSEEWVRTHGVDNLQIPIAVGNAVADDADDTAGGTSAPAVQEVTGDRAKPGERPEKRLKHVLSVEVVVHPCITELCEAAWRIGDMNDVPALKQQVIARMVALSLDWVRREAGLAPMPNTIKIVTDMAYRMPRLSEATKRKRQLGAAMDDVSKMSKEEMEQVLREMGGGKAGAPGNPAAAGGAAAEAADDDLDPVAAKFLVNPASTASRAPPAASSTSGSHTGPAEPPSASSAPTSKPAQGVAPPAKPKIEVLAATDEKGTTTSSGSETAIKRGFLNRNDGPGLYTEEGTAEGVLPDGAGDPLGYMPKSLRSKFKVVDARDGTPAGDAMAERQRAAQAPAPAAAAPPAPDVSPTEFLSQLESLGNAEDARKRREAAEAAERKRREEERAAKEAREWAEVEAAAAAAAAAESAGSANTTTSAAAHPSQAPFKEERHVTNGVTVEVVDDDDDQSASSPPASSTAVRGQWAGCTTRGLERIGGALTLVATIDVPQEEPQRVSSMRQVDLAIEPTSIELRRGSETGELLVGIGRPEATENLSLGALAGEAAESGLTTARWCKLDDDSASAKFSKALGRITIRVPLIES